MNTDYKTAYFIRTTHNFDNKTREWIYRGDKGQDMEKKWQNNDNFANDELYWCLGVHVLEQNRWMTFKEVVDETILGFEKGAAGHEGEDSLARLKKDRPLNWREYFEMDVEEDLRFLVRKGMVAIKLEGHSNITTDVSDLLNTLSNYAKNTGKSYQQVIDETIKLIEERHYQKFKADMVEYLKHNAKISNGSKNAI